MKFEKKHIKLLITIALLGMIGIFGWYLFHKHQENTHLTLQGNVDIRQVDLGFRVPGKIAEMRVEEGDKVQKNQVIAILESTPYEHEVDAAQAQSAQAEAQYQKFQSGNRPQEIAQAEAGVKEAEAAYRNAKQTADRKQRLRTNNAISEQDYENAAAAAREAEARLKSAKEALKLSQSGFRNEEVATAKAALEGAQARLAAAETNFADTQILAPADGVILTRIKEPGAIIAAGTSVYTLSLENPVWVRAYVAEPDLARIKPGAEVEVTADGMQEPIKGQVGYISPRAEFTPKNIETRELRTDLVYRVRIVVQDGKGVLRQGMPVTATVRTQSE